MARRRLARRRHVRYWRSGVIVEEVPASTTAGVRLMGLNGSHWP